MTEQAQTQAVVDPVHMDPDGSWWFYTETWTHRYGPYPHAEAARQKLGEYIAWLNQNKANDAQVAQQQAAAQGVSSEADAAVGEYIRLRDMKSEIEARHKAELADIRAQLETSEAWLLGELQRMGVDSFKVAHGTVYTSARFMPSIGDKEAFFNHIRETGEVELVQSRVSSDALKTWMANHGGQCPPGVKASYERVIGVRRK